MMMEVLCGLIIGDEFRLYDGAQLFGIFIFSIVTIVGIQVIVMKKSQLTLVDVPVGRSILTDE